MSDFTPESVKKAVIVSQIYQTLYPVMLLAGFPPAPPVKMFSFATPEQWEEILTPICLQIVQNPIELSTEKPAEGIDDAGYVVLAEIVGHILSQLPPNEVGSFFMEMFPVSKGGGKSRRENAANLNLFNMYYKNTNTQSGGAPFYIRNGAIRNQEENGAPNGETDMYNTRELAQAALNRQGGVAAAQQVVPYMAAAGEGAAAGVLAVLTGAPDFSDPSAAAVAAGPIPHAVISPEAQRQFQLTVERRTTAITALVSNDAFIQAVEEKIRQIREQVTNDVAVLQGQPGAALSPFAQNLQTVILQAARGTSYRRGLARQLEQLRGGATLASLTRGTLQFAVSSALAFATYRGVMAIGSAAAASAENAVTSRSNSYASQAGEMLGAAAAWPVRTLGDVMGGAASRLGMPSAVSGATYAGSGAVALGFAYGAYTNAAYRVNLIRNWYAVTTAERRLLTLLDREALAFGALVWRNMMNSLLDAAQVELVDPRRATHFIEILRVVGGTLVTNQASALSALNRAYAARQRQLVEGVSEVFRDRGHLTIPDDVLRSIEAIFREIAEHSAEFQASMEAFHASQTEVRRTQLATAAGLAGGAAGAAATGLNAVGSFAQATGRLFGGIQHVGESLVTRSQAPAEAGKLRRIIGGIGQGVGWLMQGVGLGGRGAAAGAGAVAGAGATLAGAAKGAINTGKTALATRINTSATATAAANAAARGRISTAALPAPPTGQSTTARLAAAAAPALLRNGAGGAAAGAAPLRLANGAGGAGAADANAELERVARLAAAAAAKKKGKGGAAGGSNGSGGAGKGGGKRTRRTNLRKARKSRKSNRR